MAPLPTLRPFGIDLDRSAVSRYLQLSTLFRRKVQSGEWPVGQQIPTVEALTGEFGVSPDTIRKAVGILVDEGLIARYRAKGSYVLHSPIQSLWWEIETHAGVMRAREGANITVLSRAPAKTPPFKPHEGKLAEGGYLHLRRLYKRDDRPFLIDELYVHAHMAKTLSKGDLSRLPGHVLVQKMAGTNRLAIFQTMTIGEADVNVANWLQVALNSPVARIDRAFQDSDGMLISVSSGVYRGDVVRLDFREDHR